MELIKKYPVWGFCTRWGVLISGIAIALAFAYRLSGL